MTTNKKIRGLSTIQRLVALAVLALLVLLSVKYPLSAQAVTQSYSSDQQLQRGMLVQLKKNDTTKVEPVSQKTMDQFHGVVVDANDAPVTISGSGDKTFVATSGHYDVLVSDQNGPIAAGDYVTVSALDGIGMKVSIEEPFVVGRAITDFDGKAKTIGTAKIKDSTGTEKTVNMGRVQIDIGMGKNPYVKGAESAMPDFLKRASEAVAGKPVNAVRVYVGVLVFLITTIVASILLYAAVRSAVISIGRNPLSRKTIIRGMFQVVLVSLIVFITGLFGVYLLLKV
jgi:hypothetical protein